MYHRKGRLEPRHGEFCVYYSASDLGREERKRELKKAGANAQSEADAQRLCEIFLKYTGEKAVRLFYQSAANHEESFESLLPRVSSMLAGTQMQREFTERFLPKVARVAAGTPGDTADAVLSAILAFLPTRPEKIRELARSYGQLHPGLSGLSGERAAGPGKDRKDDGSPLRYVLLERFQNVSDGLNFIRLYLEDDSYPEIEEQVLDLVDAQVAEKEAFDPARNIQGPAMAGVLLILSGQPKRALDHLRENIRFSHRIRAIMPFLLLGLETESILNLQGDIWKRLIHDAGAILFYTDEAYGEDLIRARGWNDGRSLCHVLDAWRIKAGLREKADAGECLQEAEELITSLPEEDRERYLTAIEELQDGKTPQ
ncbi:MAG TPA: hypothetical protein DGX96_09965 [Lachnospiraceae bacterium]|nr:hypothetical protein [Lachnospiraceae bacterium]